MLKVALFLGCFSCCEALAAVNSLTLGGLEGNLAVLTALYANCCKHLSCTLLRILSCGAALSYDLTRTDVTFGLYAKICIYRYLGDVAARLNTGKISFDTDVENIAVSTGIETGLVSSDTVRRYLKRAREFLSEYEYRVLVLHLQGYTTAETAEELSVSAKSVDNAKARCFKRLREKRSSFSEI